MPWTGDHTHLSGGRSGPAAAGPGGGPRRAGPARPSDVVAVARHGALVRLTAEALAAVPASRAAVEALAALDEPVYGVSTGFGALATRHIPAADRERLQRSLVRSHAAGTGPEVEREVVRALMLLRLHTLATGRTGVRPETGCRPTRALLNAGITPVVHEYGSLGCSGDLAPLSAVALALIGEGAGPGRAPARSCPPPRRWPPPGSTPVTLAAKEGLALINGTDGMLGMLAARAARPAAAAADRRRRRRDDASRRCSAPTGRSPPT